MSLSVNYSFEGEGNWSLDATSGSATEGGTITVDVPEGSVVEAAFLYATTYNFEPSSGAQATLGSGDDSTIVTSFQALGLNGELQAYRANVTTFVASVVGNGDTDQFSFNV